MECVSRDEVEHVLETLPRTRPGRHPLHAELRAARRVRLGAASAACGVTIDNLYALQAWPELFRGRELFVRIDPGTGRGHHQHVRTAGTHSKFGVPLARSPELERLIGALGLRGHRPARPHRQRHLRRQQLDQTAETLGALAAAASRQVRDDRYRRRLRRAGRRGPVDAGSGEARPGAAGLQALASRHRALGRARPLLRLRGRRAAGARDAAEEEGRARLPGRRHGHERADPPGAVRRVPRDREPEPPWRSRRPSCTMSSDRSARPATCSGTPAAAAERAKAMWCSSPTPAPMAARWPRSTTCAQPPEELLL